VYRSPLRQRQAAQTRASVLRAAAGLFSSRGWSATTMGAIASEADTAVETVYSGFGSKAGVLTAAIDFAIVGDDAPTPLAERAEYAQLGVGSVQERVAAATRLIAVAHERSVPLLRALQEAAASDATSRARWDKYEADRRAEIAHGLALVVGKRVGVRTVDAVWALSSPEVFGKLVLDRGWSRASYERWLVSVVAPGIESGKR
jgi:AcrR family transcriptional regulator